MLRIQDIQALCCETVTSLCQRHQVAIPPFIAQYFYLLLYSTYIIHEVLWQWYATLTGVLHCSKSHNVSGIKELVYFNSD